MGPNKIILAVCKCLNLDVDKLLSTDKQRKYTDGRFIAIYLIREKVTVKRAESKKPYKYREKPFYSEISYLFKRNTHTAALNAEFEAKKLIKTDKEFKKKYDMVVNCLDNNVNIA